MKEMTKDVLVVSKLIFLFVQAAKDLRAGKGAQIEMLESVITHSRDERDHCLPGWMRCLDQLCAKIGA